MATRTTHPLGYAPEPENEAATAKPRPQDIARLRFRQGRQCPMAVLQPILFRDGVLDLVSGHQGEAVLGPSSEFPIAPLGSVIDLADRGPFGLQTPAIDWSVAGVRRRARSTRREC